MITIPYTWSQGRSVQAWGSSAPTPGHWYLDYSDPAHVTSVTWVYRALPWWLALDHGYHRDRRLVVMMSAPTDDGQRGRLRVYRAGEGDPTTLTEYTDVETNDTSGAAMGIRASGEIDLLYIHGGALKHRKSDDGGQSFGAATTITLAGFTPNVATWSLAVTSPAVEAAQRGGYVAFDYLGIGGIILIVTGQLTGAVDGDKPHIVKGSWDETTGQWTFGTVRKLSAVSGFQGIPYRVQAMPTGEAWLLPFGQRVTQFAWDGTCTLVGNLVIGTSTPQTGAVAVTAGQMLAFEGLDGFAGVGQAWRLRRLYSYRWNGTTNQWVFGGQATTAERLRVWCRLYTNPASQQVTSKVGKLNFRPNRTWEYLYLAEGEVPTIVRAPAGVPLAGTPVSWS